MLFHILKRPLRHKMSHIAAFLDALADEGGRNLQDRGFHDGYRRIIGKVAAVVALSGENEEFVIVEDFLVVAPMLEVLEAVHAADENKLAIRVLLRERVQGVDGVGRSGQVHFNIADAETRVVGHGQLHHFQTLVVVEQFGFLLQRVLWRDHKPQLIQIGEFDQIVGQHHMAVMDGIERT